MNLSRRIVFTLMLLLSGCSFLQRQVGIKENVKEISYQEVLTESLKKTASPIQKQCVDALCGAACADSIRAVPNNISVGIFLEAFSKPEDGLKLIEKEFKANRSHIRVNLMWSDAHKYGSASDVNFITKWSKALDKVCIAYPGRLQIAPFTEHNLSNPDQYLSIVKANAPNCGKPVNSAYQGKLTNNPAYENEVHGSRDCPLNSNIDCSYSYDGNHAGDSDVSTKLKQNSHAVRFCMWFPGDNLRYSMKDSTPRPQRIKEKNQRKPSKDLMLSQAYLFTEKGPVQVPAKWIIKTFAEKHGPNDVRGDKLLLITDIRVLKKGKKGPRPEDYMPIILKRAGKKLGTCNYYGPFDGFTGGQRYYCPMMGFKYGPNISAWLAKKNRATFNGGFRAGSFRPGD